MLTHCARVNQPGRHGLPENKRLGKQDYVRGESKLTTRGHVRNIQSALVLRSYNTPCFDNPEFGSIDSTGGWGPAGYLRVLNHGEILLSRERLGGIKDR